MGPPTTISPGPSAETILHAKIHDFYVHAAAGSG